VVILVLAATIGPLGNVFSIAALVTAWKADLANSGVLPEGADELGTPVPDQKWSAASKNILEYVSKNDTGKSH
jgi:hypothetical protein